MTVIDMGYLQKSYAFRCQMKLGLSSYYVTCTAKPKMSRKCKKRCLFTISNTAINESAKTLQLFEFSCVVVDICMCAITRSNVAVPTKIMILIVLLLGVFIKIILLFQ